MFIHVAHQMMSANCLVSVFIHGHYQMTLSLSLVFEDFMLLHLFFGVWLFGFVLGFFFVIGLCTVKRMSLIFMCMIKVKAEFHFSFFRYTAHVWSLVVFLAFIYFLMKQEKKTQTTGISTSSNPKSSQLSFFLNYFSLSTIGNTVLLDVKPHWKITIVISNFLEFMIRKIHGFCKLGFPH